MCHELSCVPAIFVCFQYLAPLHLPALFSFAQIPILINVRCQQHVCRPCNHFIFPALFILHTQVLSTQRLGPATCFSTCETTVLSCPALGCSSFSPHFSPFFPVCLTTLLFSRALGTRFFFPYFSPCFPACLWTVLSSPALDTRRASDSYYFCCWLVASVSYVTCFIVHQTPRKFQYFVIQDSSIMLGLLEESLKHKGKLFFCSACITQSYSLQDTWLL